MPRLPDITSLGQPVPESSRAIAGYNGAQAGDALARLGTVGEHLAASELRNQYAEDQAQSRLQVAYGKANYLQGLDDARNDLAGDNDYATYLPRFEQRARDLLATTAGSIADPRAREGFLAEAALSTRAVRNQVLGMQRQGAADHAEASALDLSKSTLNLALAAADPAVRDMAFGNYKDALKASVDANLMPEARATQHFLRFRDDYGKAWLQQQPVDRQIELLSPGRAGTGGSGGGADTVIGRVLGNEGGYVAVDGSSGAPAIYGINARWHPDEFARAKQLADTRGEAAGLAYAREFYKREYWDKYGIGSLPPATQAIVMDGVVNHTTGFADQLVGSARGGASPDDLLSMRQAEYERLATDNPGKYGPSLGAWTARLDGLKGAADPASRPATGSPADFVDAADRPHLLRQALAEKERQIRAAEDQAAWDASVRKVQSGTPLDPKDKLDRQALNTYFDAQMGRWQQDGADPQKILDLSAEFAAGRGLVPDKLQSVIRGGLRGGDPRQAIAASDAVRRIKNQNVRALDDFAEKDLGLAEHIGSLVDAGFNPQEAYRRAIEAETAPRADAKARDAEYRAFARKNPADAFIMGKLDSWLVDDPNSVPSPMVADFDTAAGSEFRRTGDMDAARAMGLNAISRNWGASRVGADGNRYMRQSPERFYGRPELSLQENADWMNRQLLADAATAAPAPLKDRIAAGNVSITPAYGQSDRPAYYVNVRDADGVEHTLADSGNRPLLWRPDYRASEEGVATHAAGRSAVARARDMRGKYQILDRQPADRPDATAGLMGGQ